MKERPILFSGEMVKAIIEDRKTQTRRVIQPQPILDPDGSWRMEVQPRYGFNSEKTMRNMLPFHCPYGKPGDYLWVKETFGVYENITCAAGALPNFKDIEGVFHRVTHFAGKEDYAWGMYGPPRKRSGRFMPRSAARLILEIVNVRVERVQDISEDDAEKEGVSVKDYPIFLTTGFHELWDSINQMRGYGWDVNPWVWVIEFKKFSEICSLGYDMKG